MGKTYEVPQWAVDVHAEGVEDRSFAYSSVEDIAHREVLPRACGNEHYDQLRAALLGQHLSESDKVLLFTGPARRVGVSVTAANFGLALAEDTAATILLVDCNPIAPSLHSLFGIDGTDGVSDLLSHCAYRSLVPQKTKNNLHIAAYGRRRPDPIALFQSAPFSRFLSDARQRYDYVILDAPPILGEPAASLLCTRADGIILVAHAARTRRAVAHKAQRRIENTGTKVFGVVLNKRQYSIPEILYRWI